MSSGIYNKNRRGGFETRPYYHHRRSIRLPGYDYSQPGYYFVTVCIHDRKQNLFADIVDAEMVENEYGAIVRTELMVTEKIRPNIKIDTCIIMPNHVHVILGIRDVCIDVPVVGAYCNTPLRETPPFTHHSDIPQRNSCHHLPVQSAYKTPFASPSGTIGAVVRGIKSTITKQINILRNSPGTAIWQRNYYEHIIRDEKSLFFIRKYIRENPINWVNDRVNHIEREITDLHLTETNNTK